MPDFSFAYYLANVRPLLAAAQANARNMAVWRQQQQAVMDARTLRVRLGAVTGIALGASQDVAITWSSPFPSATYQYDVSPAVGILGNGTCAVVAGSVTASGLTVRVTATVLISAGATFVAVASC